MSKREGVTPLKWVVASTTARNALVVGSNEVGHLCYVQADSGSLFKALSAGTGSGVWENADGLTAVVEDTTPQLGGMLDANAFSIGDGTLKILNFGETATAVNWIKITNAATGNNAVIQAEGEANSGIIFENDENEQLCIMECVATAVNELTFCNAATGANPYIACTGEADTGITLQNAGGEEIVIFNSVATSVNELTISSAATGNNPLVACTGEDDTGITFQNAGGEEILILNSIATSVNELTISSAATGNNPLIACTGEADTGITLQNSEGEEICIFNSIATSVNELTIASAATGNGPQVEATGTDTDINIELIPKALGYVDLQGGVQFETQSLTPDAVSGTAATIEPGAIHCTVGAVTNDADDWIVLPAIADVPVGHRITILCNAGSDFELRTVASSGTTINGVDADGTNEYLCTDTNFIHVTKVSASAYQAHDWDAVGAIVAAHVPN